MRANKPMIVFTSTADTSPSSNLPQSTMSDICNDRSLILDTINSEIVNYVRNPTVALTTHTFIKLWI